MPARSGNLRQDGLDSLIAETRRCLASLFPPTGGGYLSWQAALMRLNESSPPSGEGINSKVEAIGSSCPISQSGSDHTLGD